jgi:hypothetical protein
VAAAAREEDIPPTAAVAVVVGVLKTEAKQTHCVGVFFVRWHSLANRPRPLFLYHF